MENKVSKKGIMFAIISSLESDFIDLFASKLQLEDIPNELLKRSNRETTETNELLSYLRGLDIQAYIEIANNNIDKLQITKTQKDFLNLELCKLIPIRNRVMHPRIEGITDFPVLQTISYELCNVFSQFDWSGLKKTLAQVEIDPSVFQLPQFLLQKNERIIHNLPKAMDYDETNFIGRRREIGEVREKLNKRNVHVLSIIGDGGVGKTALTLKLLYDLLDDPKCSFELILWVTLKTNALTGYEFRKIEDAITTTAGMYSKLGEFVGTQEHEDVPSYLIELAQNFNTLLVLDNLETINTSEVKDFIDNFSEYGKVLITSRIGLGEMEHRYRLEGLNTDDVLEYMDVLLDLYGMPGLLTNDQKNIIAKDELHSNPLAIKWFVKSLHNYPKVETVLEHKNDLIAFCMSNVYDKLSDKAREVLELLQIANLDLSYGELVYYTDSSIDEMVNLSYAINELIKCNFLDDTKYRTNSLLSITEFALEFLRNQVVVSAEKVLAVSNKQKRLGQFKQQLEQNKATNPTSNYTFHCYGSNRDRIVAAYYLGEAVEAFNKSQPPEVALEYANIAKTIALDYSEVYIVLGLCYSRNSPDKAKIEYERALNYSQSDYETAIIHTRYARFLRQINSFPEAIDHLETALTYNPKDYTALFELIMTLSWVNKFERADELLDGIDINELSERQRTDYYMRRADLLRRKAETYSQEHTQEAFGLLKEAYRVLYEDNVQDKRKASVVVTILVALSHLSLNTEIEDFIIYLLDMHYRDVRNTEKYKNFQKMISDKMLLLSEKNREKLLSYSTDINYVLSHLGTREGVIIRIKDKYGFMRVATIPTHISIDLSVIREAFEIGDVVSYERIIKDGKGFMATGVRLKYKAKDIAQNPDV